MSGFNLKKHKIAQITSTEKYLRQNELGPADDSQTIAEKTLPHREGEKYTTTEDQMSDLRTADKDFQIIEKVINDIDGKYVDHRKDEIKLTAPPINVLVEKMRQERLSNDYKPETKSNWTIDFNDKEQNGKLPEWPKAPNSKDVNRYVPEQWNKNHPDADEIVSGVTKANVDNLVNSIKTGKSLEFDAAMVAILRQAESEKRELSPIERKTIVNLKMSRTSHFMQK